LKGKCHELFYISFFLRQNIPTGPLIHNVSNRHLLRNSRFSTVVFFHQTIPLRLLIYGQNPFWFLLRIRKKYSNIKSSKNCLIGLLIIYIFLCCWGRTFAYIYVFDRYSIERLPGPHEWFFRCACINIYFLHSKAVPHKIFTFRSCSKILLCACTVQAVSLTLHAFFLHKKAFPHKIFTYRGWSKIMLCMRCQWHRVQIEYLWNSNLYSKRVCHLTRDPEQMF
jgi:hypothetical protein